MIQEAGLGHRLPSWYIEDSVCDACYKLMADEEIVARTSTAWPKIPASNAPSPMPAPTTCIKPEMAMALGLMSAILSVLCFWPQVI